MFTKCRPNNHAGRVRRLALLLSLILAAVMGCVYWLTLDPLGRLLRRREMKILAVVTVEVE